MDFRQDNKCWEALLYGALERRVGGCISLGLMQKRPTLCVLPLFGIVYNFCGTYFFTGVTGDVMAPAALALTTDSPSVRYVEVV